MPCLSFLKHPSANFRHALPQQTGVVHRIKLLLAFPSCHSTSEPPKVPQTRLGLMQGSTRRSRSLRSAPFTRRSQRLLWHIWLRLIFSICACSVGSGCAILYLVFSSMRSPSLFLHTFKLLEQISPPDANFFSRFESIWAIESCAWRLRRATELSLGAFLSDVRYVRARRDVKVAYSADGV